MKSLIKIISVLAAFGISYLVGTASLSAGEAPQLASQSKLEPSHLLMSASQKFH